MSTDLKRIQAVELDLLREFIRVCDKYHLKYYASGGTLLGCVRHGGFIPWDDDVDIDMPREDYCILCDVAAEEFKHPYFLQTAESDKGYFSGHAKLRNSTTTGMIAEDFCYTYNGGIFIDIFPMDYLPEYRAIQSVYCFFLWVLRTIIYNGSPSYFIEKKYLLRRILRPFFKLSYSVFDAKLKSCHTAFSCVFNCRKGSWWGPISAFPKDRTIIRKSRWYSDCIMMPFASLMIAVPKGYRDILTLQYGADYMTPQEKENRHGKVWFDCDRDYRSVRGK